ncbi:MAG: type II secretion system F family protein [Syntrophobacterales bacterium]|nr:MAG: type II secretion system F family protein [Syntrophobacterales bacterium]
MPLYSYTAKKSDGKNVKGELEAISELEVIETLHQRALTVLDIVEKKRAPEKGLERRFSMRAPLIGGGVKHDEVLLFVSQMSAMVEAGLPLLRCLTSFGNEVENPQFKRTIDSVSIDVEEGSTFFDALSKHPKIFSKLFVNMVKAGEVSGRLDQTLSQLASYLEKTANLRRKVKAAITYPLFLIGFTAFAIILLVTKVVPVFQKIYAGGNVSLPTPTKILIASSVAMREYYWALLLIAAGIVFLIYMELQTERGRFFWDKQKLGIPILGQLMRKYSLTKFTRTLGVLINSGVPILAALDLVAETADNKMLERAIRESSTSIEQGSGFAEALSERRNVFPEMVIQMSGTGEESGTLDRMLSKVANFYEQQIEATITTLTTLIEPILIIFIGAAVGSILLSIFLPIFKMGRAMH